MFYTKNRNNERKISKNFSQNHIMSLRKDLIEQTTYNRIKTDL